MNAIMGRPKTTLNGGFSIDISNKSPSSNYDDKLRFEDNSV